MSVIKQWIYYIFKIPQSVLICYEKEGKKYIKLIRVKGKKTTTLNFLVEHLLDSNLEITEETLQKEKQMFFKLATNK